MRVIAAVALLIALAGCAPNAVGDTQHVELEGRVTEFTASSGGESGWLIETAEGLLPLDIGDEAPPLGASGVVVAVPATLDLSGTATERFDVLEEYAQRTEHGLPVLTVLT